MHRSHTALSTLAFLSEFSDHLDETVYSGGNLIVLGDFNFYVEDISDADATNFIRIIEFTCGVHVLANMADTAEQVIKLWEKENKVRSQNWTHRGSTFTEGHVKAVCNLFYKESCSGVGEVSLFMKDHWGGQKIPLEPFSRSRFNIIFHHGGGAYTVGEDIHLFTDQVVSKKNQLHTAILADLDKASVQAGCRARAW